MPEVQAAVSRKRKPSVILGPDGKPYVAPEPKREVTVGFDAAVADDCTVTVKADGDSIIPYSFFSTAMDATGLSSRWLSSYMLGLDPRTITRKPKPKSLATAMAEQVAALTADFEGEAREELPTPARDLDTYVGAYASAAANCLHEDAVEMLYGREWSCDACGRSINREEMRRARQKRSGGSIFGWYGS